MEDEFFIFNFQFSIFNSFNGNRTLSAARYLG